MANPNGWKPYYMKKEKYPDGRDKILIAWYKNTQKRYTISLLPPEDMMSIMVKVRHLLRNGYTVPRIVDLLQENIINKEER